MRFKEFLRKAKVYLLQYKGLGIVTTILLIGLGIVAFIFPRVVGSIAIWSFMGSIFITGLFSIICYFTGNANEAKHPFNLMNGVINLMISLSILIPLTISTVKNGFLDGNNMIMYSINMFLGIYFVIHGLFKMISSNKIKAFGGSRVSEIILGVVELGLGIAVISLLLTGNNTGLSYVIGTYLIFFAIDLIVELITNPLVQDKNKIYTLKKAKPNSKNEEVEVEIV